MGKNVVTVFNQLTQSELADYTLFRNVLEHHYEKFKYFYSLMDDYPLNIIQKIVCKDPNRIDRLVINIKFTSGEDRVSFNSKFSERVKENTTYHATYFRVRLSGEGNSLNISIENKSISEEDEIYGDRFNTN